MTKGHRVSTLGHKLFDLWSEKIMTLGHNLFDFCHKKYNLWSQKI